MSKSENNVAYSYEQNDENSERKKITTQPKTIKDYSSNQDVRWCPGCGDYSILRAVQKSLADDQVSPENTVFVSGIGCSSRLPYYMETYGFHTVHGRAPTIATGIKLANPKLDVWVITGDGDGLSIGSNHLMHTLRRNLNVNILLINNEIYGLTKGQYSPTSPKGSNSVTSPKGSIETPVNPGLFALGCQAKFIARAIDNDIAQLTSILRQARKFQGSSFVEVFQNCHIFNDNAFADFTSEQVKADKQIHVEQGKPLLFGKNKFKGLHFDPINFKLTIIDLEHTRWSIDDVLIHDETNPLLAQLLLSMNAQEADWPIALGVLFKEQHPSFEQSYWQLNSSTRKSQSVQQLLESKKCWLRNTE